MRPPFPTLSRWLVAAFALAPTAVLAQATTRSAGGLFANIRSNIETSGIMPGTATDAQQVIGGIITGVIGLLGVIFFILILYGGYLWMTARGNEQQIEKAKNIIKSSTIGLAVVLGAYLITFIVVQLLISQTQTSL